MELKLKNSAVVCNSYGIDLALLHAFVFIAKMLTGQHRPLFFDVCKPDAMENCTPGTFITDYKCTNSEESKRDIQESSQSFFSSHAALFIFSTTFLAFYLQKRFKQPRHMILIPLCQLILLLIGYFGAISRILDHHHHPIDVIAGGIFGFLLTIHAVRHAN